MIINKVTNEVLKTGIESTVRMSISKDEAIQAHVIKVLTENYKYPLQSHIREAVSNHWDSHIENGNSNQPIFVKLFKNDTGNYTLETSDEGLGLSEEEFYKYYMGIGESTKRERSDLIGGMGCGAKAALSYKEISSYEVTCRKNGIENKFLVFKGDKFPEALPIYSKETNLPNGVIVSIQIKNWDYSSVREAIKKQLCYFPTAIIQIENDYFDYLNAKIYENDLFKWSEMYPSDEMHISFGHCHYPIDWELLNINKINIPIAIKIPIDSGIEPFFNRESLTYDSFAKEYILDKIKKVANWFIDKYNSEWKEYETLVDGWRFVNEYNFYLTIKDNDFKINNLEKYADNKIKTAKIKNIENAKWYIDSKHRLLSNYSVLAESNYSKWTNKYCSQNIVEKIINNWKIVIVNYLPTHKVKSYFKDKYEHAIFIKKFCDRKLGKNDKQNSSTYYYTLDLDDIPKENWRSKIQELNYVENQLKENFIYELDVENSQGFKDWLETQKKERVYQVYNSNHKVLNKQDDEVTLAIGRNRSIGNGVTFEKETFKVNKLSQTPKLTIYFEDKDRAAQYYELIGKKYRIAIVGKREQLKIKNIHNFMTEQEFQKSKVFKRIVTSIMFDELVQNYKNIFHKTSLEVIHNVIKPLEDDINLLEAYTLKNGKTIRDNELLDSIIAIAKEYNLYDYQFMDVYNRCKESLDKYKFLNYIQKPDRWNETSVKEVNSIITQFLYHQKMYRGLHSEIEFVVKEKEVVENLELETV